MCFVLSLILVMTARRVMNLDVSVKGIERASSEIIILQTFARVLRLIPNPLEIDKKFKNVQKHLEFFYQRMERLIALQLETKKQQEETEDKYQLKCSS